MLYIWSEKCLGKGLENLASWMTYEGITSTKTSIFDWNWSHHASIPAILG